MTHPAVVSPAVLVPPLPSRIRVLDRPVMAVRRQVSWGIDPNERMVRDVRTAVVSQLSRSGYQELVFEAGLIASELLGNAVRHAGGADIKLTLTTGNGDLLIEVEDGSGKQGPVLRTAGRSEESGRGLALVNSLSARWSWRPLPNDRKCIWAYLGRSL